MWRDPSGLFSVQQQQYSSSINSSTTVLNSIHVSCGHKSIARQRVSQQPTTLEPRVFSTVRPTTRVITTDYARAKGFQHRAAASTSLWGWYSSREGHQAGAAIINTNIRKKQQYLEWYINSVLVCCEGNGRNRVKKRARHNEGKTREKKGKNKGKTREKKGKKKIGLRNGRSFKSLKSGK